jgi:hypothetical protein
MNIRVIYREKFVRNFLCKNIFEEKRKENCAKNRCMGFGLAVEFVGFCKG